MLPPRKHEPITDWSQEGRRRLIEERGDQVRLLLDEAFTDLLDSADVSLRDFRFQGEDPVTEAVDWCVEYFVRSHFDVEKLRPRSRSMRLFTEASFWLTHRESAAGYRRIRAQSRRGKATTDGVADGSASPEVLASTCLDALRLRSRIIDGITALRDACCTSLVGWWLQGTVRERRDWFASNDPLSTWDEAIALARRSPKQRSFDVADALFRYLALIAGLVARDAVDLPHRACVLTWFSPCDDRPPYEVGRESVRAALGGLPSQQMTALRADGVESLVRQCVALAGRRDDESDPLVRTLARRSLRRSVLHRFQIKSSDLLGAIQKIEEDP
jgi:hypothetical protein